MKKLLAGIGIGAAAATLAWLAGLVPFVRTVELKTYDWRLRWSADPSTARDEIVLVRIDEESIRNLEPLVGRWPWPRLVHAFLVDFLARAPAKVVVLDVLFTERDRTRFRVNDQEWSGEESDRALVDSVGRAGNVVLAADATRNEDLPAEAGSHVVASGFSRKDSIGEARPFLQPPIPELAKAGRAVGHTFLALDRDGPVRRHVPFVQVGDEVIPSLGVAAWMAATGTPPTDIAPEPAGIRIGDRHVPLVEESVPELDGTIHRSRRALIDYRGPVSTYREHGFYELFYSEQQLLSGERPLVDPASFTNKIVVVGVTAAGLHDVFTVPFELGKMPGVQIHAAVIDDLLSSRFVRPIGRVSGFLLTFCLAVAIGIIASRATAAWLLTSIAAAAACLVVASTWLFGRGVWTPFATPALAVVLAGFGGVTYQYVVEGREKRKVKQIFSRFVPRDVFRELMADPARARLGGERRQMSVLFCDIRGFTSESERLAPEEVVRQLNEYFSEMVDVLFHHRGTVDKFVGDMVMALFGAPLGDPDHADHAVEAAVAMLASLERLNRTWRAGGRPVLRVGIGINSGEMVAGNIGSDTIMSYTVIGDAVNLASRLEALNKDHGTTIIVSEHTHALLKGRYNTRPLGAATVKGRAAPVGIFEVQP